MSEPKRVREIILAGLKKHGFYRPGYQVGKSGYVLCLQDPEGLAKDLQEALEGGE